MPRSLWPFRTSFDRLWEAIIHPRVPEQELEDALIGIRRQLPAPVIWLLGKAQSGKSSIVRTLTGATNVEIGNGFKPCTRTASLYAFPSEEDCLMRFLDTRGLGEVGYDPTDDMNVLADQAHVLLVVVKALDHAYEPLLAPLEKILDRHPRWPVIVAQTCLHEAYERAGQGHPRPYPFREFPLPERVVGEQVPDRLARSLAYQREWFCRQSLRGAEVRFVPIDFTSDADGLQPVDYGADALWEALEAALPLGLRGMIEQFREGRRVLRDQHFRTAHPHVLSYALAAGLAAGLPVPWVDMPLVVAIQAKMFHALASIYRQEVTAQRVVEVSAALGLGFVGRLGLRELLKFVPGIGSVVAGTYAAASTYALGCAFCAYFSFALTGDVPPAGMLRRLYHDEFRRARQHLSAYLRQMPKPPPREAEPEA
jgi:uncharacterized protein (DUF697 family)